MQFNPKISTLRILSLSLFPELVQVIKLEAHKAELIGHMHRVEDCCAQLMQHLKVLKEKWCATCVENVKLYKKIFELRKALNPGRTALPSHTFDTPFSAVR